VKREEEREKNGCQRQTRNMFGPRVTLSCWRCQDFLNVTAESGALWLDGSTRTARTM